MTMVPPLDGRHGLEGRKALDYLIDRAYPDFFHAEQSPLWLNAVLAALGRPAPATKAGWCEIGCGQGFGATVLAAANPQLQFTGIDINPTHIATARARAKAAKLGNIDFICADISDATAVGGRFDYIVCHGVASWVTRDVRAAIARFVVDRLSQNGIAALHYMSDPGGAAFRAFHAVFRSLADRPDPVGEGLALLRTMRDVQAGFFQLHPHAGQALDVLFTEDHDYLAHEYLNPQFEPLAFRDVHAMMDGLGLAFLGSATPIENMDAISVPAQALPPIAATRDLVLRETLKDLARNQVMRYDIYARPMAAIGDVAHLGLLRQMIWGLRPGAPDLTRHSENLTFDSRIGPVEGDIRILRPLFDRLVKGPARFAEIEHTQPFAGRPGLLNQALQMALWAKICHPVQPMADPAASGRLNRILIDDAQRGRKVPALAAPHIGSGHALSKQELRGLVEGKGSAHFRHFLGLD